MDNIGKILCNSNGKYVPVVSNDDIERPIKNTSRPGSNNAKQSGLGASEKFAQDVEKYLHDRSGHVAGEAVEGAVAGSFGSK